MLPIHYLAKWGPSSLPSTEILLESNKFVLDAKAFGNMTPLNMAEEGDYPERDEVIECLQKMAVISPDRSKVGGRPVRLLLEVDGGTAATLADPNGMLPIHYLAKWGPSSLPSTEILLESNKFVLDAKAFGNMTPLNMAEEGDYPERDEVIECLQKMAVISPDRSKVGGRPVPGGMRKIVVGDGLDGDGSQDMDKKHSRRPPTPSSGRGRQNAQVKPRSSSRVRAPSPGAGGRMGVSIPPRGRNSSPGPQTKSAAASPQLRNSTPDRSTAPFPPLT